MSMKRGSDLTLFQLELPQGAQLTPTGWKLPALSEDQWRKCGEALGKVEQGKQWWIGDWWNALPHNGAAGLGREACEAADIEYQTTQDDAMVARSFDFSRRRETLSFKHHREVCAVPDAEAQDRLLDWCEEPLRMSGGKPRSTRELREAVQKYLDAQKRADSEMSDAERGAWNEALKLGGQMIADFAERRAENKKIADAIGERFPLSLEIQQSQAVARKILSKLREIGADLDTVPAGPSFDHCWVEAYDLARDVVRQLRRLSCRK